ncbi:hypothetical protein, partial [Xenorhabdus thuongxuanensis]
SLRSGLANSLSTTGLSPARIVQLCPAHRSLHSPYKPIFFCFCLPMFIGMYAYGKSVKGAWSN